MNFYFISPIGRKSDYLYDTFVDTFIEKGHQVVDSVHKADFVFYDIWCGFGEYNNVEILEVLTYGLPVAVLDFHDYLSNDRITHKWPGFNNWEHLSHEHWAYWLRRFIDAGLVKKYFMRKMSKKVSFPEWVIPIDACLYPDHDFELDTIEQFKNRTFDICFIGNSSPWRSTMVADLVRHGFSVNYCFPYERLERAKWFDCHWNAKLYLECDAGGFGSERPHQLSFVAAQLRYRNDHLLPHPWTDGVNCIEIGDQDGNINEADAEKLRQALSRKGNLYDIYVAGAKHMKENYSAEARAKYILNHI